MSSLKNALKAQQKNYKERSQCMYSLYNKAKDKQNFSLGKRKHLGILEKHKDYVLRARDYHRKEKHLNILKKKASEKNPDEFYFKMVKQKTKDGVHELKRNNKYTSDQLKLMKTQDVNYINFKKKVEAKKIEKLQSNLHFLDNADDHPREHIFFVDSAKEAREFDPAKRLNTAPELLSRAHNRPTMDMLQNSNTPRKLPSAQLKKLETKQRLAYQELQQRIEREKKLDTTRQEMEIQKLMMGKGRRQKLRKQTEDGKPIYKWKKQRKR